MSNWIAQEIKALDEAAREAAIARDAQLTKPPGALGQVEQLAIELAAMQGGQPQISAPFISIFAADHGIAASGVSAFPQEVTAQMVANFASGGAAISVLARQLMAPFEIVNLGTVAPTLFAGVTNAVIAAGTANMLEDEAMSPGQCEQAMARGKQSVEDAAAAGCKLFIGGEMGIGNTTSATALAAAITGNDVASLCGPGTGLSEEGVARKVVMIEQVLKRHNAIDMPALQLLHKIGGFEIAALVGAYIRAAQLGITVLVDGFICTAAAIVAQSIAPRSRDWMLFAHGSAEPGHRLMLKHLEAKPLLDLSLRLGEGSGAALVVPLLQMACELHSKMATFEEAAVAGKLAAQQHG